MSPETQLNHLDLHAGLTVLDCGVGAGNYALEMARRVGPTGAVHVCDIQKPLLEKFLHDMQYLNLPTGKAHWVDFDKTDSLVGFTDASIDRVLVANLLWQLENPQLLFQEIARVLKPNGRILVIEWSESHGGIGPHADHVVHQDAARRYIEKAGLSIMKEGIDVGQYHYGLVCSR